MASLTSTDGISTCIGNRAILGTFCMLPIAVHKDLEALFNTRPTLSVENIAINTTDMSRSRSQPYEHVASINITMYCKY